MSELRPKERALLFAVRDSGPQEIATDNREAIHLVRSGYAEWDRHGRLVITPAGRLRIYQPKRPIDERRRHVSHEGE